MHIYENRDEAGRGLAARLAALRLPGPIVVLALPRGGVPVAAPIARALNAPLDLVLVRKIGAPWQSELALAAVVEGDPPRIVADASMRGHSGIPPDWIDRQAKAELEEIARQRRAYLHGRPAVPIEGCTAIVVDDGVATGSTLRAALEALRSRRPARLVLAVPVAPADSLAMLAALVDQVVCPLTPRHFHAVGAHYRHFDAVGDDEVVAALDAAASGGPGLR